MHPASVSEWVAVIIISAPMLAFGQSPGQSGSTNLAAIPREVREEIDRIASDDAGKRGTGATSLGQMGAKAVPAIPYLVRLTDDTTKVFSLSAGKIEVGNIASESLIAIGPKGVQALITQLTTPGHWRNPARALGRHKVVEALPPLTQLLSGMDVYDGLDVVQAIGELGDSRGVEPIMTFLLRVTEAERFPTQWQTALQQLTGQKFGTVGDATSWWERNKGNKP